MGAMCPSSWSPRSTTWRGSRPRSRLAPPTSLPSRSTGRYCAIACATSCARSNALLEARGDERVQVAVEDRLRVADLDVGAQVLDARLVEHVGADLVAPADVGLGVLQLLLLLV